MTLNILRLFWRKKPDDREAFNATCFSAESTSIWAGHREPDRNITFHPLKSFVATPQGPWEAMQYLLTDDLRIYTRPTTQTTNAGEPWDWRKI